MIQPTAQDIERFMKFVSPEPNSGCWLYTGSGTPAGYGYFQYGGRKNNPIGAHRFSAMVLGVLHRCDLRCCVNPDHLFLGNHKANMRDMVAKGRHRLNNRALDNSLRSHCVHGHPLSGDNLWIRKDGSRICKTCRARIHANWRKK
jgi:hypothetical protein